MTPFQLANPTANKLCGFRGNIRLSKNGPCVRTGVFNSARTRGAVSGAEERKRPEGLHRDAPFGPCRECKFFHCDFFAFCEEEF